MQAKYKGFICVIVTKMLPYRYNVPRQAINIPLRLFLFTKTVKAVIVCPHMHSLDEGVKPGDLVVTSDTIVMNSQSSGVGSNLNEFGPRFYDMSTIYNKDFSSTFTTQGAGHCGGLFWINEVSFPCMSIYKSTAKVFSTEKVPFKAMTASGLGELFAVAHFNAELKERIVSQCVGVITEHATQPKGLNSDLVAGTIKLFDQLKRQLQ